MRRLLAVVSTAVVIWIGPATAALADPGAPGHTFPEQPGGNLATACVAVDAAPATGGGTSNNVTAFTIISGLLVDACAGG